MILLTGVASAKPLQSSAQRLFPPVPAGSSKPRLYQVASDNGLTKYFFQSYRNKQDCWLEVFLQKESVFQRTAKFKLPDVTWSQLELDVTPISTNLKDNGFILFARQDKTLRLIAFPQGWTGNMVVQDSYSDSEFSTTGWTTVNLDTDPKTGLVRVDEADQSPGKETASGRQMDVHHVYYTWSRSKQRFLKQK